MNQDVLRAFAVLLGILAARLCLPAALWNRCKTTLALGLNRDESSLECRASSTAVTLSRPIPENRPTRYPTPLRHHQPQGSEQWQRAMLWPEFEP